MEIALLNVKVTFQKNSVVSDSIGTGRMSGRIIIPAMPRSAGRAGRKGSGRIDGGGIRHCFYRPFL